MKVLIAAAAVALLPAALACDYSRQPATNCAKLQIADCSGETHCEAAGPPSRVDMSRATPKKAQTNKKRPPAKRRP
jgi:hypothetical protein